MTPQTADALAKILTECGLQAMLTIDDGVDRSKIRSRLELTPLERLGKVSDADALAAS